jgi:glycosyltransferase involved in cell wall biosynthesis
MRGRILVVDHATPTPDQDSGSASVFAYLRILTAAGFKLTFVPGDLVEAGRYTHALNDLEIVTPAAPDWPSLEAAVESLAADSDVLLLYRAPVATRVFALARRAAPTARIVFHPVDLHFLRMEREAALIGGPAEVETARAMRMVELDLIRRADATIVVSNYEASLLAKLAPPAVVHQVPIMRETPKRSAGMPGFAARRDFLFIGGYRHRPNVDALLWFVRKVWPLVQAKGFADRFVIVGSHVPDEIAALASDRIEVRGQIADLATLFDACRLSIAPLRYGGGIKGKIVTSLSYGVPVVGTSIAAEGMGLQHDENILVADKPRAMAKEIVRLYHDADLWQRLSSNGYAAFLSKFSEASGAPGLLSIFDDLVTRPKE